MTLPGGLKLHSRELLLQPGNVAQHMVASSERIRADFRYTVPVDIDEAIRRIVIKLLRIDRGWWALFPDN